MSTIEITPSEPFEPSLEQLVEAPILVPVEGIDQDTTTSRSLFDGYVAQREAVKELPKIEGQELTEIQESVRSWIDAYPEFTSGQSYDTYSEEHVVAKLGGLTDFLRTNHPHVNELELTSTEAFVKSSFSMFADRVPGEVTPDADGSFAFVVPARMSRKNPDYGQEVEPVIPALRYVSNELRAQMMVGLPPFIIDTYKVEKDNRRGYLVYAPISSDMIDDLPGLTEVMSTARHNIDQAVDFAYERLGVEVVGLGAILPSLTNFGKAVTNENVVVTTGHGGTAYLVEQLALKAVEDGLVDNQVDPKVGVLGLGAIGGPIAQLIAKKFAPPISIYDSNPSKVTRTEAGVLKAGGIPKASEGPEQLIAENDVVISAIVGRFDMSEFKQRPERGRWVAVDDAQPGSFDPEQVADMGGTLIWVIGRDTTGAISRSGYDYGTMVDEKADIFGCEAEAATLYRYREELRERGMPESTIANIMRKVAVREAVTAQKARYIGALFIKYGVTTAPYQAFGKLIEQPSQA